MTANCRKRSIAIDLNGSKVIVNGLYSPEVPSTRDYPGDPPSFEISTVIYCIEDKVEVDITDLIESLNGISCDMVLGAVRAATKLTPFQKNPSIITDLWTSIEELVLEQLKNE